MKNATPLSPLNPWHWHDHVMQRLLLSHAWLDRCWFQLDRSLKDWLRQRPAIPRRIHQVFVGSGQPGEPWTAWTQVWRALHPDFEYRLWRDADCDQLVREHDEPFRPVWESIPAELWILKADYIRMLAVAVHGGFYFDCDVEPLASIAPLCARGIDCVLFFDRLGFNTNAAFGATPYHPVLSTVLQRVRSNIARIVERGDPLSDDDILWLTGPLQLHYAALQHGATPLPAALLTRQDFVWGRHLRSARNGILVCPENVVGRPSRDNVLAAHWLYNSWTQSD